ncbi:MAG: sulfotransferase domain-containing protein [Pseudomonadota bacterium]
MICFFAGAHKNGSHFQFYVLEEALRQRSIPYRVVGADVFHEHDLSGARKLLSELRGADDMILCKGHWYRNRERRLLLDQEDLKVFLIWRDLKDVLISSYHYKINKFGADYADFSDFYFADGGRDLLIQQRLYRMAWSGAPAHETSYEALVDDFSNEAARLLAYAGIDDVDLESLKAETKLGRLRETRGDENGVFFRKGTTGQHRGFELASDVEADIETLLLLDHMALQRERWAAFAKRGLRKASSKLFASRGAA